MSRAELLRSKEYWMVQFQNDLYGVIEKYMEENGLSRTNLAEKFGVSKGYITQILKGDFDHKISKLIELSLATNMAPVLHFIDLERFINDDANDKYYELIPMIRPKVMTFEPILPNIEDEDDFQYEFSPVEDITTGETKPVNECEEVA